MPHIAGFPDADRSDRRSGRLRYGLLLPLATQARGAGYVAISTTSGNE